jgi:GMP synthase-like glutamine amidotransferase
MSLTKCEYRELRKAAERALKKVVKSLKEEPSTIIITGSPDNEPEPSINEIISWLFKEEENGSSNR